MKYFIAMAGRDRSCCRAPAAATGPMMVLGCLFLLDNQVASGVLISTRDGAEVRGFLIRQDDTTVVIDEVRPDGTTERRTIARTEIALIVATVSAADLAGLRDDQPADYRDLAEELVVKRKDLVTRRRRRSSSAGSLRSL